MSDDPEFVLDWPRQPVPADAETDDGGSAEQPSSRSAPDTVGADSAETSAREQEEYPVVWEPHEQGTESRPTPTPRDRRALTSEAPAARPGRLRIRLASASTQHPTATLPSAGVESKSNEWLRRRVAQLEAELDELQEHQRSQSGRG